MAKNDRVLAIDIGATSIKLCEFVFGKEGEISLAQFAHREYEEELSDSTRLKVVAGLLRQMLAEGGFRAKKALLSLSGQSALMRFARLPVVNYDKKTIRKLAEFEATNNIPFPVKEVLYDYQLIAAEDSDQIDELSVVIKNDVVTQLTDAVIAVGCNPIHVDAAPIACFNAARANGLGDDGCVIILNIGGRNTTLLFAEGDRFFARNIPTAGHSITQQIAKEFGIRLPEAEELKRRHGYVALGGAYAESESETAANVSKIIRTVMARLHGEVQRSINVYKSQQHGSSPVKMYLTGGSSILNYCDIFFQEKLGIPVEYFNPFQIMTLPPSIDRTKLSAVAHVFSETVGLALRYSTQCPIEISLVPKNISRQQRLSARKPYLFVAGLIILLTLGLLWNGLHQAAGYYQEAVKNLETAKGYSDSLKGIQDQLASAESAKGQTDEYEALLMKKCLIPNIYKEIALLRPNNLTITSIIPIYDEAQLDMTVDPADMMASQNDGMGMMDDGPGGRGMEMRGPGGPGGAEGDMGAMDTGEPYIQTEKIIYGYKILGFCYMLSTSETQAWNPEQEAWTDFSKIAEIVPPEKAADAEPEPEPEPEPAAEEGEEGENAPKKPAAPAKPKLTAEEKMAQTFQKIREDMQTKKTPDQAFIMALLRSPLFDKSVNPNEKFDSQRVYVYPQKDMKGAAASTSQMNYFELTIKLAQPAQMSYTEYAPNTNRGNASMGGPGGPMDGPGGPGRR